MKPTPDHPSIHLPKAVRAWQTSGFEAAVKEEIQQLDVSLLPLQQGLCHGSHALGDDLSVMVISVMEAAGIIRVKAGIHYSSVLAGCSCADDPTPADRSLEYCEMLIDIDTRTAEATLSLPAD